MTKFCAYSLVTSAAIFLGAFELRAQSQCDSSGLARETELVGVGSEYARLAELSAAGTVTPRLARRLSNPMPDGCTVGPWGSRVTYLNGFRRQLSVVPISLTSAINGAYPEDRNNGAMWSGRGVAGALEGGLVLRLGFFSAGAIPVLTYQQNRAYELLPPYAPDRSVFAGALYRGLDLPQRFGPKPYSRAFWGQSYARIEAWKFDVGFSTENVWWGPGISNAILFTNTAPGFPHVFINVRRPLNIGIGRLSLESLWGRLSESQYFDTIVGNNDRMIVGALLVVEPKWVPGLFLGFGRTFVMPWDSVSGGNLFPLAQPFWKKDLATPANPRGRSNDDQRISLMSRYVLPAGGFEVYGEWAREDHAWDQSDFVQEPEHSSAHLLGFQKLFTPTPTRWVRAYVEWANLQQLRQNRSGLRNTSVFYVHDPQGHTQLGQLLGASIGPGGESQLFGVDVLNTKGLLGFYTERVRRDEFSARGIQAWSTTWPPRHDVAITGGMRFTSQVGPVRIDSDMARSKRYNRNFLRHEWNTRGQLRVTWSFHNPARSSTSQ